MIAFHNIKYKPKINKKKTIAWLNNVITEENKTSGSIVYVYCDDKFLLNKNIEYLKHNTLTDVITFDYSEGSIISGDILISIQRVEENANIFEVTFLNELQRVMLHGLLHLLGYKDKTKKEKEKMIEKENYYLKRIS